MDFFTSQENARRQTGRFIFYFVLGLLGLILSVYAVVVVIFVIMTNKDDPALAAESFLTRWDVLGEVALATGSIVALGSLYKTMQLSKGGDAVALMLGGRPINIDTRDPGERRILNVVEEMAIASGVPVPPVYLLENEPGINAFAAGHLPSNAVIGVTRGTVEQLSRDEFQGVMAHEFSHILNGDMKLNIRMTGIIHGILVISVIGFYVFRMTARSSNSSRKGGAAAFAMAGLAIYVIGYIGVIFGQLIRAAMSRQREFLADASAVQFTRNPEGIAGALKRIATTSEGSKVREAHAEEVSHMFFAGAVSQLFATHPPLTERIKRLDPHWDGTPPPPPRLAPTSNPTPKPAPRRSPFEAIPGLPIGRLAEPSREQLQSAQVILAEIPASLGQAMHEPFSAQGVVYAILLHADPAIRDRQLDRLSRELKPSIFEATIELIPLVDKLSDETRLPAVELALPALREMSHDQYMHFRDNIENLVNADQRITIFEFVLQLFVLRCLDQHFGLRHRPRVNDRKLKRVVPELLAVLSVIAHIGTEDEASGQQSFDAAFARMGLPTRPVIGRGDCNLTDFAKGLDSLATLAPKRKQQILEGVSTAITVDGKVTVREYELMRTIASVLEMPMIPLPPISA